LELRLTDELLRRYLMSKPKYSDDTLRDLQESVFFRPPISKNETNSPIQNKPSVGSQNTPKKAKISDTGALPTNIKMAANQNTQQKNETTNVRTNERFIQRRKIRHTFDIYEDQLMSLKEISLEREKAFGSKTLLGDLVQEALDTIITKERNKD